LKVKAWGERGESGDSFLVTPSTGEGVEQGQPQTAIVATSGAREELCSGGEKGRARVGAGRGGYGGAYHGLNQARDSRRKGIDARAEAWSGASMVAGRAPLIPGGLAGE